MTLKSLRALTVAAFAAAAGACVTPETTGESLWPPEDFSVAVRRAETRNGVAQELYRFRVFGDGLALWRQARRSVGGAAVGTGLLPVLDTVCCYRLRPESLRMLSRELDAAGVGAVRSASGDDRDPEAPVLAIRYRGFGRDTVAFATGDPESGSDLRRVLDVLHGYVPAGRRLMPNDLTGRRLEPALLRVPEPTQSIQGSLRLHQDLCRRYPEDLELVVDAFALAVAHGERELAGDLLARAVRMERAERGFAPETPSFPSEAPGLEAQLRAILEAGRRP